MNYNQMCSLVRNFNTQSNCVEKENLSSISKETDE